jgi:hypothetical protein
MGIISSEIECSISFKYCDQCEFEIHEKVPGVPENFVMMHGAPVDLSMSRLCTYYVHKLEESGICTFLPINPVRCDDERANSSEYACGKNGKHFSPKESIR